MTLSNRSVLHQVGIRQVEQAGRERERLGKLLRKGMIRKSPLPLDQEREQSCTTVQTRWLQDFNSPGPGTITNINLAPKQPTQIADNSTLV